MSEKSKTDLMDVVIMTTCVCTGIMIGLLGGAALMWTGTMKILGA